MAEMTDTRGLVSPSTRAGLRASDRNFQAYKILHIAFIVAPTIAGLDKFFHLLVNWDQYLAPQIARLLPMSAHGFMLIVGVIEMAAGLLVALKPRIGAYVVAAWLGGIILNLLIHGSYFDIALRDFGLLLGAIALGRLSEAYERGRGQLATAP
ncbi:MAG TPA: hypothetical protein VND93_13500 [Myxococcales bacterium]|jgi:hypothetical protein|nr:hypothetical protein [Myxococcales bacterium]